MQQKYAMFQRKRERMFNSGFEVQQEFLDVVLLPTDARKDRQIRIASQSRFTPMQNRDPADEAKRPAATFAESLNFQRGVSSRLGGDAITQYRKKALHLHQPRMAFPPRIDG